jgi:hypothetical protein
MTSSHADTHHVTRKPLAILIGVVILVLGHSAYQESMSAFGRSLPFLLILILGELTREWVARRLPLTASDAVCARRRIIALLLFLGGATIAAFLVAAVELNWLPKRSVWVFPAFGAFMIAWSIASAFQGANLLQRARERALANPHAERWHPGPGTFAGVLIAAFILCAMLNASNIEVLASGHILSGAQIVRLVISVVVCVVFATAIWRAMHTQAEQQIIADSEHSGS